MGKRSLPLFQNHGHSGYPKGITPPLIQELANRLQKMADQIDKIIEIKDEAGRSCAAELKAASFFKTLIQAIRKPSSKQAMKEQILDAENEEAYSRPSLK